MQFLNPLFFIGFLAVAIPIAVHLFNFRRYKKVYFSDISKLEELTGQTKRRSQIKQLLILAARVLAIVFLVLAFAR
ncbi:MAG: BatA domain-containing protein, partial [Bacteroidales bacterium]|nr:BatA domain-containing protein [Bacteroidales bacterium]